MDLTPAEQPELQIREDMAYQCRSWTAERIGWAVMTLLVTAALLGLLGPGWLSHAVAGDSHGPFWIEYDRFAHHRAPSNLVVHLGRGVVTPPAVRVWFDRAYLSGLDLEQIVPHPERMEIAHERVIMVFPVASRGPAFDLTLSIQPEAIGRRPVRAGLDGGGTVEFTQFVYP